MVNVAHDAADLLAPRLELIIERLRAAKECATVEAACHGVSGCEALQLLVLAADVGGAGGASAYGAVPQTKAEADKLVSDKRYSTSSKDYDKGFREWAAQQLVRFA